MKLLKEILVVAILAAILGVLLGGINSITKERIAQNERKDLVKALKEVSGVNELQKLEKGTFNGQTYYTTPAGNYILVFEGAGVWGPIKGVLLVNKEVNKILDITIIRQEETPGLGGKVTSEKFLGQFRGQDISKPLRVAPRSGARSKYGVDAITAATLTTKAFLKILNSTIQNFREQGLS